MYNSYVKTGTYPPTPEKVKQHSLDIKLENGQECKDKHGPNILKHSNENYKWTLAKLVLINQY